MIIDEPSHDAVIQTPRVIISGKTDPAAAIIVNGINAVVEPNGRFKLALDIPRGLNKLEIIAKRRYGIQIQDVRYITYAPLHGPEPAIKSIIYSSDSLDAFFSTSSAASTESVVDL